MNIFKEYYRLGKAGVKNLPLIFDGAKTKLMDRFKLLNEDEKQELIRRMDICLNCPYNSENALKSDEYKALFGKKYDHHRPDLHCSLCGCNLELKTASLESACGIRSHNQNYPNHQLEEKWQEYEPGK